MVYSFTNRSNFPKNEEINVEAAYIKVYPMDTMNIICPSNNNEILTIYQVFNSLKFIEWLLLNLLSLTCRDIVSIGRRDISLNNFFSSG